MREKVLAWAGFVVLGAVGWVLSQTGACLYHDLAFLHQARLVNEYQASHPEKK